jgi:hypothetical protein
MEKIQATAGEVSDPAPAASAYIKPQYRPPHDPTITFEEYHHYALKTRDKELALEAPKLNWREFFSRRKHAAGTDAPTGGVVSSSPITSPAEKDPADVEQSHRVAITDEEWENASRALRTASDGACT